MKFESTLDFFILFIIFVKIVFVLSAIGHLFLTHMPVNISNKIGVKDSTLVYWKERTEFIFIVSMSILLVYHFRPGHLKPISSESSLLFFLFGCILIITSKWSLFFKESLWYKKVSQALQ
jgi:hypothetical protein